MPYDVEQRKWQSPVDLLVDALELLFFARNPVSLRKLARCDALEAHSPLPVWASTWIPNSARKKRKAIASNAI